MRIPELPTVTGTVRWFGPPSQWRIELPQLDDLLNYVSGWAGLLNLPWRSSDG